MADAQLSTSITSISERASEVAQTASADELQKISRVAPSLEQSENAALEVAINTRAAAIAGTATASDLKKIGKAIGNMLEPQTASVSGEFIGAQSGHSGKFFSTNGTAKNWGGVTMGGLQQVQLSTIENDQTLVYNSVSGKFENSSRAFDIPQYSLTQNLPASGTTGEVVFDVQSSQLKYWDGSEWKTAAVVAASSGGGSSSAATTLMVVGNQNSYYGASGIYVYDASDLSAQATKLTPAGIDSGDRFGLYVAANSEFIFAGAHGDTSGMGAVYAYDVSDLTAAPTKLIAHDRQNDDSFGKSIAASSNKLVVGAPEDDDLGNNSGSVYVFDTSDLSATPTKLTAFDGSGDQKFGALVAASDDYIVVSAGFDNATGSVYVFDANDLSAQPTKLTEGVASDKFAVSIAVSSNHIVVGAWYDSTVGNVSGAAYVYDASNLSASPTKLTAYDTFIGHRFGASVAASDDYIAIGTHEDTDNGDMSGAVYVYDASDLSAQPTKVTAFDGSDYDQFARTGSISINSDRLIVGSQTDDDVVNNSGSAYIFDLSDLSAAATKVTAHDAGSDYRFGSSVAMVQSAGSSSGSSEESSGGSTVTYKMIVGSWRDNDNGAASGSVYVYDLDGTNEVKITASDGAAEDSFGWTVAVDDGKVAIGARNDDDNGASSGSVYVYDLDGSNEVKITSNDSSNYDFFGNVVALGEGKLAVGARNSGSTNGKGAVYVYEVSDLTSAPTKLVAADVADGDDFGASISITSNKLVIGSPEDDDVGGNSGSVYVYDSSNLSATPTKLTAFDGSSDKKFGLILAANDDYIVVSSGVEFSTGAIYVYDASNLSAQPTKLSEGVASDKFGISIAVSSTHIVVGARGDSTVANAAGAVYVYDASNLSATPTKLTASDGAFDDQFGISVAIGNNKILVGANQDDDGGNNSGSVYVYDLDGTNEVKITASDGAANDQFGRAVAMVQSAGSSSGSSSSSTPVDWSPLTLLQTAGKSVYDITSGTTGESDLAVDMTETHTVLGVDKAYSGYGSAYIIDTVSGNVTATINNPNPLTAGSFGRRNSVGTDGTHVVLGNRDQDQVYVYDMTGTLLRTITGPDSGAMFGHSVKIDGDYIVVGGYNQDKAYICSTSTGAILHTLTNPNVYGSTPDQFGQVVDISGNFMVVSTVEEDAADGSNSGVAYVYTVDAGSLLHTFVNPNAHGTSALDNFGIDCAIDGNYLVVGAFGESDAAVGSGSGKAYFYNVATGTLLHTIDNPNPDSGTEVDYMGWSVDVEGQTAIVSAWYETGAGGADSGKCYLYDVVSGNLLHTIEDPNVYSGGGTDDRFGSEVAISGTFIAISAKGEDHASQNNVGAIYVFKGE